MSAEKHEPPKDHATLRIPNTNVNCQVRLSAEPAGGGYRLDISNPGPPGDTWTISFKGGFCCQKQGLGA